MKYIFRTAIGVVFTFFLLLFLFVSAVKIDLLSTKFWIAGVERSGMYQELSSEMAGLQKEIDGKVGKGKIVLSEIVTETRVREVVEKNVVRLVDYLNGRTEKLALWLPLFEWKLPKEVIGGLPKLSWSTEMELEKVLPELGFPLDQVALLVKSLNQVRVVLSWLPWVWLALLFVTLGLLLVHYHMGEGRTGKIKGVAILLLGSGLFSLVIGWGGGKLGGLIASSTSDWPVFARALFAGWTGEFFSLGKVFGLVMVIIGLILFVWITYFVKQVNGEGAKGRKTFS